MIVRTLVSLSFYDTTVLLEAVVAMTFAAAAFFQTRFRYSYLWNVNIKMLVAVSMFLAVSDVLYLVVYLSYPRSYLVIACLEVLKDLAGMAGVCFLAMEAAQTLIVIEQRRDRGIASLFEFAPLVFGVFFVAALPIALWHPIQDSNLDISSTSQAVAYRWLIGIPSIFYANLTALFFFEAYLRRWRASIVQEATLLRRYLLITITAFSLGLVGLCQALWPATQATEGSAMVQGFLFLVFAVCGSIAFLLRFEPGDLDTSMETFALHQEYGDELAFEVQGLLTMPLDNVTSLVPRQETDLLVEEAARLLKTSSTYNHLADEEVNLAKKTFSLAARISQAQDTNEHDFLQRVALVSELPDQFASYIPYDARMKDLATNGPLQQAVRAAQALMTTDISAQHLINQPTWVKLVGALLVYSATIDLHNLNALHQAVSAVVDEDLTWAAKWAPYLLRNGQAFQ